jgi:RNA polymerase sigma-70 factor (ECF subfamily)
MTQRDPIMAEGYRVGCLSAAERIGNDELHALMAGVVRRDRRELQQLFATVTPLLIAFYEGQLQAGRIKREETSGLVQESLMALYLRQQGYDPNLPFRAWILDIARSTLRGNPGAEAVFDPLAGAAVHNGHEALQVT